MARLPGSTRSRLVALGALVVAIAAWPGAQAVDPGAAPSPVRATSPTLPTTPEATSTSPAAPAPATTTATRTTTPTATATTPARLPATAATPTSRPGTAVTTLATLVVKGRAPRTGYDRALFGQAWADADRNGCDTRNDILRRDLRRITLKAGTRGCLVLRGTLADPYTARSISFVRGQATSTAVQIDHVVALSDAWQKGAQQWTTQRRTAFANDPLNLLAVDGPTNLRKSDGDAATWLPPSKGYRCAYVARQIAVKHRYAVSVTAAERDAMTRVLTSCPGQPLPTAAAVPLGASGSTTATGPAPAPAARPPASTPPPAPPAGGTDQRYGTCKAAIAAGLGPYRRGADPEYEWYQDRDHDGLVCER